MNFLGKIFGKALVGFILIPAVLLLFQNHFINRHTHNLPNGEIVEHSHPFKKSNSNGSPASHDHDTLELIFFAQLSDTETEIFSFCPYIVDIRQTTDVKSFLDSVCIRKPFISSNPTRGPPWFNAA